MSHRFDLDTTKSEKKGLAGLFETALRSFKTISQLIAMIPIYIFAASVVGLSLFLPVSFFRLSLEWSQNFSFFIQSLSIALTVGFCYFLYGASLLVVVPTANFLLRANLKSWRGPYHSLESVRWFIHNGLTYLARFTFLEFVTPSPLSNWFYQSMGMKIGKGSVINTTWISDPSMIQLGKKVTLGGSVTLAAHYGQGGLLVIAPISIGDGCTIGLKSSIMGGVTIGANTKILPHSVVLPKTQIPAGEIWGGVPAQKLDLRALAELKKSA